VKIPLPPSAATEARNPASRNIDSLSALQIAELMNQEDAKVAAAVALEAPTIAAAIDQISSRMQRGGRLIYQGAGTSGRLGVLDPTFSVPPGLVIGIIAGGRAALTSAIEGAEDRWEEGARDLEPLTLTELDTVMGIATSGRTPYVLGGIQFARTRGCLTLGLACNHGSALAEAVDLMITTVVGPEVITGSTRLKAGTATKMVLNMLTTGTMIRLGKTYGNLMVDVTATNEKLRDRSTRIVAELTSLSCEDAAALLDFCGGEVKTAIVSQRLSVSPKHARQRLMACGGHLRAALRSE
jgi:N-acetylmuramic acid 6-phosphate etherase